MKLRHWRKPESYQIGFDIFDENQTHSLSVYFPEKGHDSAIGFHTNKNDAPSWGTEAGSKPQKKKYHFSNQNHLSLFINPKKREPVKIDNFCSIGGIRQTLILGRNFISGPSRNDVIEAIEKYRNGERQTGRSAARSWHLIGPDGHQYPAKHIWGIASGVRNFQTHTTTSIPGATVGLRNLGFHIINLKEEDSTDDLDYWTSLLADRVKSVTKHSNGQTIEKTVKVKNLEIAENELGKKISNLYTSQNGVCALSGIAMNISRSQGNHQLNPSLDRKDSSGHYSENNIQLVCKFINQWKQTQSDDEFRDLLKLVRAVKK